MVGSSWQNNLVKTKSAQWSWDPGRKNTLVEDDGTVARQLQKSISYKLILLQISWFIILFLLFIIFVLSALFLKEENDLQPSK